ncbi:S8 family peptidase [Actinokineospora diospyrosa]|uniref:Serine protease, subtilisin family n=1 Tax=Actinokineospora diospyrosa TaxID=103728 RepID=A0ABT1IFD5_9PSEU|nr:S8 family peptidase [Actinokineospora diospyrosa]MCP2271320.1 Serine protease, subtilisin family [Actinokineospora diospyrosa]
MYEQKRRRRLSLVFALITLLSVLSPTASGASNSPVRSQAKESAVIDGSYIVVFKDAPGPRSATSNTAATTASRYGAQLTYTYRHALNGFAGRFDAETARKIAADPAVAYVSQDLKVKADGTQVTPPSWGLDRIDQRDRPSDNTYNYPANTASNVTAYIIDGGIRTTHQDFGGRATWGTNTTGDGNNTDCNGHGTHVAGTVGGSTYGVAKAVKLVAVKVLNCDGNGTSASFIAGLDWVTANHVSGPAVANVSLGASGTNQAWEDAVRNSINDGIVYAISAGNDTEDACNHTPARTPQAITVGATDINDRIADFSNYGTCVDILAPGEAILSAYNDSDTGSEYLDGTSMAAPHVTGAAALLVAAEPTLTPARAAEALLLDSTPNKVTAGRVGTPNRLLATNTGNRPGYPVVANPGFRAARVGTAFSLTLTAAGGTGPYKWTATGLPAGLTINLNTGAITGTPTTAATSTATVTTTDAANRTRATAFQITVTPAAGSCSSPGQRLVNPGFESGFAPWNGYTNVIGAWTGGDRGPRTGTRAAIVNGNGVQHDEMLNQAVLIPAGCVHSTLSFYLRITTEETDPVPYDTVSIWLGNTILATYSNTDAGAYALKSFPVGAYAGQVLVLTIDGSEDFAAATTYSFDDFSLVAS